MNRFSKRGVAGNVRAQDIQRLLARQAGMLDQVDLAHAPRPQQPQNPVSGDGVTSPQRHGRMLAAAGCKPFRFSWAMPGALGNRRCVTPCRSTPIAAELCHSVVGKLRDRYRPRPLILDERTYYFFRLDGGTCKSDLS